MHTSGHHERVLVVMVMTELFLLKIFVTRCEQELVLTELLVVNETILPTMDLYGAFSQILLEILKVIVECCLEDWLDFEASIDMSHTRMMRICK